MPERVPHDHPSVRTFRAEFARSGGTRRVCLRLPDDVAEDLAAGDLIRLVLDGSQYHAQVAGDTAGLLLRGAFDNRRLARESGAGDNRLREWAAAHDRGPGESVDVDEIDPGYLYGLREPGATAVYEATRKPDQSLADIARDLDG
jgi:hypothetical protein